MLCDARIRAKASTLRVCSSKAVLHGLHRGSQQLHTQLSFATLHSLTLAQTPADTTLPVTGACGSKKTPLCLCTHVHARARIAS